MEERKPNSKAEVSRATTNKKGGGKKIPKSKKLLIASVCLFLIGVIVIFYPNGAKLVSSVEQGNRVSEFDKNIEKSREQAKNSNIVYPTDPDDPDVLRDNKYTETPLMTQEQIQQTQQNTGYDPELLAKLYADMVEYNKRLYKSGQVIADPFSYMQDSFQLNQYSIYDNIFGYVSAPSINLNLPIYLGASEENLLLGAAHMTGTSMPIGGINTNAVLAGHRGLINYTMFDNIVFLKEGDLVFITNPWGRLEYRVVKTEVIIPSESDKIKIQPGKDMLTLITCHPYGYQDYRYIVYCERVG